MFPRLSGHIFIQCIRFGFLCAYVSSGDCETMDMSSGKFAILSLKPGSPVRILIYRNFSGAEDGRVRSNATILRKKIGDREQCTTPPIMSFS